MKAYANIIQVNIFYWELFLVTGNDDLQEAILTPTF